MERITIKQVAKMAGVSATAVSLAINGKSGISDTTRARIIDIVHQTGFIPNENSRRLLFNRTGNIAVLLDQESSLLDQSFYSELNNQLIRECEDNGYNVVYCVTRQGKDNQMIIPKVIRSRDVDGIFILDFLSPQTIRQIRACDCPIIVLDNYIQSAEVGNVVFDYTSAAAMAAEYLVKMGHKDIGYIGSDMSSGNIQYFSNQTFIGYKQVMENNHFAVPLSWMQMTAKDEYSAGEAMESILKSKTTPTAILCSGDIFAIGALRILKQHGIRVPEDISLIGIDDILLSRYIEPALTTIRVDRQCMAAMAVKAIVQWIEKDIWQEMILCANHQLVERSSVKQIAVQHSTCST